MNWTFQLFSARDTGLTDALQIVSDAGFTCVEAYRDNFEDPGLFRASLDIHGLTVPSMHINLGPLRDDTAAMMQRARDFDCHHIVCPYLEMDERPVDAAGWLVLIAELSDHAKRWKDAGFTFAWHNHDFEFFSLSDGALPMQLILEHAPELQWEIDLAWIVRAEADPIPWLQNHLPRISAVHLKDLAPAGECADEDGWADVGFGVVPWKAIVPLLAQTSATVFAVEHDNPSDLQRFATRSFATLSSFSEQLSSKQ